MLELVSEDDPWAVRVAYRVRRKLTTPARKAAACIALLLFLSALFYSLLLFFNWLFDLDSALQFDIEKSAHFSLSPFDARSYEWIVATSNGTGKRTSELIGTVAASVVASRAVLAYAKQLVLVHSSYCDIEDSTIIDCQDAGAYPTARMTPIQILHKRVQLQAYRFLAHNNQHRNCVCGPMLGYNIRYIALYAGAKPGAAAAADESAAATANDNPSEDSINSFLKELDADRNNNAIVVHMFNPIDEQEQIYNELDSSLMKEQNIGLNFSLESQNYRYNETRGVFNLLRRTRVRLSYQDEQCRWLRPWVSGSAATCVQECLDMMRGIDVRERARMQHRRGVVLNSKYFNDAEIVRPSCTKKTTAANSTTENLHDEL